MYDFKQLYTWLVEWDERIYTKANVWKNFYISPYINTGLFWLKDLSIDEMVGAWRFGYLSGPQGFTCWIYSAPVFSFIYCWVLIFALSPFYILIYMF